MPSLIDWLRPPRTEPSEPGIVMVTFAGCLLGLLTVLALAIDAGKAFKSRLILQSALDASVLVGARVIAVEGRSSQSKAEAATREALRMNLTENRIADAAAINSTVNDILFGLSASPEPVGLVFSAQAPSLKVDTYLFRFLPGGSKTFSVSSATNVKLRTANVQIIVDTSASTICPPESQDQTTECDCGPNSPTGAACVVANSKLSLIKGALLDFVERFDEQTDRVGLVAFNTAAKVLVPIGKPQGFSKSRLKSAINGLTPAGVTNLCDGLYMAHENAGGNDWHKNTTYIVITDGAPTSGRFTFVNAKDARVAGQTHYLWEDYTYCDLSPLADKSDVRASHMPSRLYNVDVNVGGASFFEDKYVRVGPPDPNIFDDVVPSWDEWFINAIAPCCLMDCKNVWEPDLKKINRIRNCYSDVAFRTKLNPADPSSAAFTWDSIFNKYSYDPPNDSDLWWQTHMVDGRKYRELFYDCALAVADTIRKSGGTVYTVAIGPPAPKVGNDPYQDVSDRSRRKDIYMRRMAFDQCGEALGDPNFHGFEFYSEMRGAAYNKGLMLPISPGDPAKLKSDLDAFFEILAHRIKLRLLG